MFATVKINIFRVEYFFYILIKFVLASPASPFALHGKNDFFEI